MTSMPGSVARLAQIGCGYWGRNLARNFAELGALAAIVDGDAATASVQAELYGAQVSTLDEVLADPDIDAVALATPAETHAQLAHRALAAGKHVFVEKPLALTIEDAKAVIDAASRAGRTLMVGHLLHYHPLFQALASEIAKGTLGKLRRISSTRMSLGKFRTEENVLWSFAPHDIAMVLALAGREPDDIQASSQTIITPGIADHASLEMDFGDGLMADVTVSWLHPFKQQRLCVIGDKAMAVFEDSAPDWSKKLAIYAHEIDQSGSTPVPVKAEPRYLDLEQAQPLLLECQHFLDCIRDGAVPVSDGLEGLRVLKVLAGAQEKMDQQNGAVPSSHFVHPTAAVDDGAHIGSGSKIWHFSHILKGSHLGQDCTIGQNVMIGPDVAIGDRCKIQNNVSLYKGVTLGDGVFCGPSCVFTNVNTPRAEVERKDEFLTTKVGEGATIGANATIVCGHDIGAYSFIGAGAVITSHVPPFALMVGNPARQIGWVGHAGEKLVPEGDTWRCPRTDQRYRLAENGLIAIDDSQKADV